MVQAAALALLLLAAPPVTPGGLTEAEQAGRRLFEEGLRADGSAVMAHVGGDPSPVPASVLPCAGCHGRDGRGRPEGAVIPPVITWGELTRPRGHVHGLRAHPPFDERSFAMAVEEGQDPAGHRLDPAMPSYALSRTEVEALVAWLARLDHRLDPGLDDTTIRLATLLPGAGPGHEAGLAMRAVLEAAFAEVNAAGGVNGRRLHLEAVEAGPGGAAAAVEALARREETFALVSGFAPGQEAQLTAAAEAAGLPLVGLQAARTVATESSSLVFSLLGGAPEQARVLIDCAVRDLGLAGRGAALLRPAGSGADPAAAAAIAEAFGHGWAGWREEAYPAAGPDGALVERLSAEGVEVVLHLGGDAALAALLRQAAAAGWRPTVLVPGALAGRSALAGAPGFGGRLLLGFPTSPADETDAGRTRLARLEGPAGSARYHALQVSAASAATVLTEGLRRAGRALSREGLVKALEGLQGLETGLTPPMSFGPGRRVGALGGYVVAASPTGGLAPVGGWRRLE